MATYYIDPSWTGTASGTAAQPWTAFSSVPSLSAGDSVLFKRGTTHLGQCVIGQSGTQNSRIRIGAYYNADGSDDTSKPRPIIVGGTSDDAAVRYHNTAGLLFENLQVSIPTTSGTGNGLYGYFQSANTGYHITVRNCHAFNCKAVGINVSHQYRVGSAVASFSNIIIEDCTSDNTGSIGIAIGGGKRSGTIVRRCKVVRACQTLDFGGLYGGCIKKVIDAGAAGWTLASGTIYFRTFLKSEINSAMTGVLERIEAVSISSSSFAFAPRLTLNLSTPTTPGVGEYGYTGADPVTLYVNFGVAAASLPQMFVIPDINTYLVEDCEVSYTKTRGAGENYAFYADDCATAAYKRCWAHDNESRGFMIHRGAGCVVEGSICERNADNGISVTAAPNVRIYNNIFRDNTLNGINIASESKLAVVKNNIITGNAIGINGMADTVASNNCFYGNDSTVAGFASAGGDVTSDPALVNNRMLSDTSALYHAGAHTGYRTDGAGAQLHNPPSIGAYEYVEARTARA